MHACHAKKRRQREAEEEEKWWSRGGNGAKHTLVKEDAKRKGALHRNLGPVTFDKTASRGDGQGLAQAGGWVRSVAANDATRLGVQLTASVGRPTG